MKRVAIVGYGFMGRMHYAAWGKAKGAKVVAVCDSNLAQLKASAGGNRPGAFAGELPKSVKVYADFDEMLASGGFEIVDITLPTPLHPKMAGAALGAGYHVMCEKPMALDRKACDGMLAAAKKAKGKFMIAQCLRFAPEYVYVKELIEKGTYGKVIAADFSRMSAAPGWNNGGKSWFLDEAKSGGVILDFHIHDVDMINWLFGMPKTVETHAHRHADGWMDHAVTRYGYADKVVTSTCSWAATDTFSFESGFKVYFEGATVCCGGRAAEPYRVYPAGKKDFTPKFSKASPYDNEVKWFLAYVNGEVKTGPLVPADARNSVSIVDAERRSAKTGKAVKV